MDDEWVGCLARLSQVGTPSIGVLVLLLPSPKGKGFHIVSAAYAISGIVAIATSTSAPPLLS